MYACFLVTIYAFSLIPASTPSVCPPLGSYAPHVIPTGDLIVIPTKIPEKADITSGSDQAIAYSCVYTSEVQRSLFIYNTNLDMTLSRDEVQENISNYLELYPADVVYVDIISDKPVVLSHSIKAYNSLKELRLRCNNSLTLAGVKIEGIERLVIENTSTKESHIALAGTIESTGDLILQADGFFCSASVKLEGELAITARRRPIFKSLRAQQIDVEKLTVQAFGDEPIMFIPKLSSAQSMDFQTVQTKDSLSLLTNGKLSAFGWNFHVGGAVILAGTADQEQNISQGAAALISLDTCSIKAAGSIDCRAHVAEICTSSLMSHDALNLTIPDVLATRTSILFSYNPLIIATKNYKDELSLIKSCDAIQLQVDNKLFLQGTRILAPNTIEATDGDAGIGAITISRKEVSDVIENSDGTVAEKSQHEGEIRSLYGSIQIQGREHVQISGMIIQAGEDISITAQEGNLLLETTRNDEGVLLGDMQAGADNTSYFEVWFNEAIDDGRSLSPEKSQLFLHAGELLLNQLHCHTAGSLELSAGGILRNVAFIEAGKKTVLSAPRIENSLDEQRTLTGTLFSPAISLKAGSSGRIINTGRLAPEMGR